MLRLDSGKFVGKGYPGTVCCISHPSFVELGPLRLWMHLYKPGEASCESLQLHRIRQVPKLFFNSVS